MTAAITGGLLFSSNAVKYSHNGFFLAKMSLLLVAFANMMVFQYITARAIESWDEAPRTPPAVRLAGAISLLTWIAVIACGPLDRLHHERLLAGAARGSWPWPT